MLHVPLVQPQEAPAGRKVVVHHIEHLAVHTTHEPSQHDGIRTVIDVCEWNGIGASEVQKEPERADPHSVCNGFIARTVHIAGSDDDIRNAMLLSVLGDDFVLLHLCEGIGVSTLFRMSFDRTRLIQETAPRVVPVGVDRERADVHEALEATMSGACLEEISRRDDRIHKRVGDQFFPSARRDVIDHGDVASGCAAVLA